MLRLPQAFQRWGERMSEAYYRANLEACWRMAAKTPDELEKRAWLDMAASWKLLIITEHGCSTGEDFDAYERSSPSDRGVINVTDVGRWLARQAERCIAKYRAIRERTTSFVDLILDLNDHRRAPVSRATARRKLTAPFLSKTLASAARRTLASPRAWASRS
jgi:hypothetical protein